MSSRSIKLSRAYYQRPTLWLAQDLLGKTLVAHIGDVERRGRIVETEAYCGPDDRASHAARGKTARTAPMFEAGGVSYVYLIYGMYHCFNIVTEAAGYPAAILVRAIEPFADSEDDPRVAAGPGKLCRWLSITTRENMLDLTGKTVYIEDSVGSVDVGPAQIVQAPRIGVDYAGKWAAKLWRFYLSASPAVSKR